MNTLDIILPIYNPKSNWDADIIRQYQELKIRLSKQYKPALILVNDGSTIDLEAGIAKIKAEIPETNYIHVPRNKGKGFALRTGVKASQSELILYTDHDLPYSYGSMMEILRVLTEEDVSVVIGHRDKNYYKNLPWIRVKISHYLKTINRFILGLNTDDTQCGLKAFKSSVKEVFLKTKTNRFLIDIEFLRLLQNENIKTGVIDVRSRANVVMSTLGLRTIFLELWSYFKIIIRT